VTFRPQRSWIGPLLLIAVSAIVVAACVPGGGGVDASGNPISASPHPPLEPAEPGADPVSLLAWLFTPIFKLLFIILAATYNLFWGLGFPGAVGWAIVVLTLVVRAVLIPLFRMQLVSQRRIQMLQPEMREIQKRFKGDRLKQQQAQQELYKERGINPLSGCLPLLLQLPLLFIMYSVIQNGITNQDPNAMLNVLGYQVVTIECQNIEPDGTVNASEPCMDTHVPILGDVSKPQTIAVIAGIGISILAILSALLQLVQSRMMLPPPDPTNSDPNVRLQRQMMLFLPLISIIYGGFLPAGLFIYWIVATLFSIAQQYLIVGWGGMFPVLKWEPAFARDHTPRFPVEMPPPPEPSKRAAILTDADKKSSADKTIRQGRRGRQSRRGRRR
jgi:YidC/Oxa1 family membrane protein insertase